MEKLRGAADLLTGCVVSSRTAVLRFSDVSVEDQSPDVGGAPLD